MRRRMKAILDAYGPTVVWRREGGEQEGRAFVQPILTKRERSMWMQTPLGAADQRRWVYIGRGEEPVAAGERLCCQGKVFLVREAIPVCLEDGAPLYWWATLVREKEAAS